MENKIENEQLEQGKSAFIEGLLQCKNPYDLGSVYFYSWKEGWLEEEKTHNNFTKIQELEEKVISLEKEKKELKRCFVSVSKLINERLSPYFGKFFRFGQNKIVDDIVANLEDLLKYVEEYDKKAENKFDSDKKSVII